MTEVERMKSLRIVVVVVGLIFILGIWPLTIVWSSGEAWDAEGRSEYVAIILKIYAILGVFLLGYALESLSHSQFALRGRGERKIAVEVRTPEGEELSPTGTTRIGDRRPGASIPKSP
jgi:uncharacterized membrane protein